MYTSYFANVKNIPSHLRPISIARRTPDFFNGRTFISLAPSFDMLRMSPEQYDIHYKKILAQLDPKTVYQQLGDDAVLLCYEAPNKRCHRRAVAEWLEASLKIVVPELGIPRDKTPSYNSPQPVQQNLL